MGEKMNKKDFLNCSFKNYTKILFDCFSFLETEFFYEFSGSIINNEVVAIFLKNDTIFRIEFFIPAPPLLLKRNIVNGKNIEIKLFYKNNKIKTLSEKFLDSVDNDFNKWFCEFKSGKFDELLKDLLVEYSKLLKNDLNST